MCGILKVSHHQHVIEKVKVNGAPAHVKKTNWQTERQTNMPKWNDRTEKQIC